MHACVWIYLEDHGVQDLRDGIHELAGEQGLLIVLARPLNILRERVNHLEHKPSRQQRIVSAVLVRLGIACNAMDPTG